MDRDGERTRRLTEAAANGDRAALEELLVLHLPDLRAYVRLRMGPGLQARERESDLLQSVCREVLEDGSRFRFGGEGAFKSWLYTQTVRKVLNRDAFHRAEKRDPGRVDDAEPDALVDVYRRFATPSQAATVHEEQQRIERAFSRLSEEYRDVILLSRVVGLPRAEVAREMHRSEDSVRNLLSRALTRLAQAIDLGE